MEEKYIVREKVLGRLSKLRPNHPHAIRLARMIGLDPDPKSGKPLIPEPVKVLEQVKVEVVDEPKLVKKASKKKS
jgi:hypothetical protein